MRQLFTLLALIVAASISAQISAPIESVTVFTKGAQILRKTEINLNTGIDTIKIKGLSPSLNSQTLQTKLTGGKILDVTYNINYLYSATDEPKIAQVKRDIKKIEVDLLNLEDQLELLELKQDLIKSNQKIGGTTTLDIEDMKDFMFYYNQVLPELIKSITDTKQQISKFNVVKKKMIQQQKELQKTKTERSGEIEIIYQAVQKTSAELQITYNVRNCGWSPLYNLRAKDVSSPIDFEYTAEVYQNTGVHWKNVALNISTGNPVLIGEKPELYPLALYPSYGRQQPTLRAYDDSDYKKKESKIATRVEVAEIQMVNKQQLSKPQQTQSLTFSSFIIPQKFTLNSGAGNKKVTLLENTLPASYHYYAVPKKDNGVYLLAEVTNWEKLPLIPGKSHIYFDETFVMKSYINPDILNDTLAISLGRDQSIIVKREKIEDKCYSNSNLLGVTKGRAYTLTVKNNRNEAIKIEILDQIPISKNNKIKVDYKLGNSLVLNQETGLLTWELTVEPSEKSETNFEFEIKHPNKYNVILR